MPTEETESELSPEQIDAIATALDAASDAGVAPQSVLEFCQEHLGLVREEPDDDDDLPDPDTIADPMLASSVRTLRAQRVTLKRERRAAEDAERQRLYAELVQCGARPPARVWATPSSRRGQPYLEQMPLRALRAFVDAERKAVPPALRQSLRPPRGSAGEGNAIVTEIVHVGDQAVEITDQDMQRLSKHGPVDRETIRRFATLRAGVQRARGAR